MRKKIVVSLSLLMILPLFSGAQKSPDEFFNTTIGADRTLIAYPQIREYFNHLASASARVRISDERRKVLPGFDYTDCEPLHGNNVAHEVSWKGASIESLKGSVIRLEIFLKNADIYTFRAMGGSH